MAPAALQRDALAVRRVRNDDAGRLERRFGRARVEPGDPDQAGRQAGALRVALDLFEEGRISYEDALRNADSVNDLRLNIKLHSKRSERDLNRGIEHLDIV